MNILRAVLLLSLLAVFGTGCGKYSCEDLCKASNACPSTTTKDDCPTVCNKFNAVNSASGCTAKYDAFISCADKNQSQVCSASSTACNAETSAYFSCVQTYCDAHPNDTTNCK